MLGLPLGDWQFWVVTLVVGGIVVVGARKVLGGRRKRGTRVGLTVGGSDVKPRRDRQPRAGQSR